MSSLYEEAQKTKSALTSLINECIAEHPSVKSAIKARKAVVTTAADSSTGLVGVKLLGDNTELFLPYNSAFAASDLTVNTVVSVWYNFTLNNGVVMQNATWSWGG